MQRTLSHRQHTLGTVHIHSDTASTVPEQLDVDNKKEGLCHTSHNTVSTVSGAAVSSSSMASPFVDPFFFLFLQLRARKRGFNSTAQGHAPRQLPYSFR